MSQARLAELSGVSERTVRAIERGAVERPQLESLRRIARVLAYGEGHARRLVERWTGASFELSPQEIGVPGWESLYQRIRAWRPEDGGQLSSTVNHITVGPDRLRVRSSFLEVREPMSPTGPPVIWSITSEPSFDIATARFEVAIGGAMDEFFVHGDVAAYSIRPDPAIAQRGPFVLEYSKDLTAATRIDGPPDTEWMFGCKTPLRLAVMVVQFSGEAPKRVWSVRGETAASAHVQEHLQVGPDGTVQFCLYDFMGVYGIQWEWGDQT
jgi:transcriptional regulator with XRE-family HTH domain